MQGIQAAEVSRYLTVNDNKIAQILYSEDNIFSCELAANTLREDTAVYLNLVPSTNMPKGTIHSAVYSFYLLSSSTKEQPALFTITYSKVPEQALEIWYRADQDSPWQRKPTKLNLQNQQAQVSLSSRTGQLVLVEQELVAKSQLQAKTKYSSADQVFTIEPQANWSASDLQISTQNAENNNTVPGTNPSLIYHYLVNNATPNKYNLQLKFPSWREKYPQLYFLNQQKQWQKLDPKIDGQKNILSFVTDQRELFLVIFYNSDQWLGKATWYHYKKCLCAASRDYPKGTKLKVSNITNGKSVIIKINDYGPEKWTTNLIDLDSTAFKKIASLRAGVINVKIETVP